jgi:hypothetical protein
MGTNTGKNYRKGSIKERIQKYNPKTGDWLKIDTETNNVIDTKKDEPFKGVAKHVDDRRKV